MCTRDGDLFESTATNLRKELLHPVWRDVVGPEAGGGLTGEDEVDRAVVSPSEAESGTLGDVGSAQSAEEYLKHRDRQNCAAAGTNWGRHTCRLKPSMLRA